MGRRRCEPIIPCSFQTVSNAIADRVTINACCNRCGEWSDVDLERITELRGPDYSLIGKRTRCTLTIGCAGWIRFHYLNGVMRPLWRDADDARWDREDMQLQQQRGTD